ncbi:MAG: protein kinase [Deltaproteobacteria bacterium]|nr:protein kinase [Deltaproteobacteria bacterium]
MTEAPDDLPDLPGFEIQRRLGAGGMAEVFLALKRGAEGTFKQLVLKRILPEHAKARRFRVMFVEEAQLATRLNHPNIVQVYDFAHHGDDLLLAMEYVEGVDLAKLLTAATRRGERLPPWVAAYLVAEVAKGLHYAHERRDEGGFPLAIVHRDVSPQNILLSYGGVVKIADFGIATANLFREEQGVLKGKTAYMSPEQARGEKVDRRSDIYALGVVLHELLHARSPYGQLKDEALADAVRLGAVVAPPADEAVPDELAAIAARAMARAPEDRFATARELAAAVARALLEHRQLVDTGTIEETIVRAVGPAGGGHGEPAQPMPTMAAIRRARTAATGEVSGAGTAGGARRVVREVRHVAVVRLRLDTLEGLNLIAGQGQAARELAALRSTLDDIAYKRSAVWSWDPNDAALAVVGLMASPSRAPDDAMALALDVHEFLASRSEELGFELGAAAAVVRGIATGERDEQGHLIHHTLLAPAAYLAEELGLHTPFGQTWVAGGVHRLVRHGYQWDDAPNLPLADAELHDVPENMRVHAMLRALTPDERAAVAALAPSDLVGRDAERADLHAALHRALRLSSAAPVSVGDARPGEVLAHVVTGEMGIGKTALVQAFLRELDEGVRTIEVECSPVRVDLPYSTVAELLRRAMHLDVDVSVERAKEAGRAALRVKPGRGDRVVERLSELVIGADTTLQDEEAAEQFHDLTVRSVKLLIGALADTAPLVIVIDGLQWADRMSLELLERVLSRPERTPVLMLLVTRPDERVEPYLQGMMRSDLSALTADEQIRLVQARLGVRQGVADVCKELVPRVGGNPYFLLEMFDALLERGALELVESDLGGEATLVRNEERFEEQAELLPSTVEQLVGDRLHDLPKEERDVVDWLAVAGGPLSTGELIGLARLTSDEPLTRLCARGVCERRGVALEFRHPLARDVAYQRLDPVHRARMHRQLGDLLVTSPLAHGLSAAIVAHHFEEGEVPKQAAELYFEAAVAARGASQTQLALRYYERAAALFPKGDRRLLEAHDGLARIFRQLGQTQDRRGHLVALRELALETRSARWLATSLVRAAQLDLDEGAMSRGLPLAMRGAELAALASDADLEVEAQILVCELLRDVGDVSGALDACDRALAVTATRSVSRRARGEVLRAKGVLLRRAGRIQAALETHAEATAIFELEGARRSEARARNALGFALFVLGRYEDSIAMCLRSLSLDVMVGGRFQVAKTLANVGFAYARLGNTEQGLSYLVRAREAHERYDDLDGWVDTLLVLASVLIEHGKIEDAHQLVLDAAAILAVSDNVYDRIHCLVVQALLERARGKHETAALMASEASRLADEQALVSYQVYATAIEAASRVDLGNGRAGIKLATKALSAVESMEGSEYGIEVRSLCCEAVTKALSRERPAEGTDLDTDVCRRALHHVDKLSSYVRDPWLRDRFMERPPVRAIVEYAMLFISSEVGDQAGREFLF